MTDAAPFNPIAEFLGPAYLRNAFTRETRRGVTVAMLVGLLALSGCASESVHGSAKPTTSSSTRSEVAVPEQAVIVFITSIPADSGLDEIEDPIMDAIERADVGEFDGNEIGPDGAELYMYGPDADALWAAVRPVLEKAPIGPGSYATLRYGEPGAREVRVDL